MKGLLRSLSRNPKRTSVVKQIIPFNDLALSVDGATGVGFNAAVAADLPEGNILFLGAVAYARVTRPSTSTGIQATFDGDFSIGTTPTADATLSTTDANIVSSSPLGAATAGVSPVARGTGNTSVVLDNTDGSLELNFNLIIDDANISADDQAVTVDGYMVLSYIVLGDD